MMDTLSKVTDTLSYRQLFNELEDLNTSAYDMLIQGNFEGFTDLLEAFADKGIAEQERFPYARAAYRFSAMPFTLNHMWIGPDQRNMLSDYIFGSITEGWTIKDIQERDLYPVYVNMVNSLSPIDEEKAQAKQERIESRLSKKRWEAYEAFIDKYNGLYKQLGNAAVFGVPLVDDVEAHQMSYIQRVVELAEIRSRFHLTFDFTCTTVDNTALEGMNLTQKIKYLTDNLPDLYQKGTQKFNPHIQDFLTVKEDDERILASNYIQGKGIDRKNWKNYTHGQLPNIPLFYLELAFYLAIPSSDEIEKFMNLHGYSIKGSMTHFHDIYCGKNVYHILHRDLCRWIDAGIDYNLINEMCGMKLSVTEKEQRLLAAMRKQK